MTTSPPPAPPPLDITIRFPSTDPDLHLTVLSPATTTTAFLKSHIRTHLSSSPPRRLRLIHSGAPLPDTLALSALLPRNGKAPASVPYSVYIHCSIGDNITPAELAAEQSSELSTAAAPPPLPAPSRPAPLGFDRLLSAGFSETEVAALRSQFNRLNSDVAPEDIRALEDRWIDESAGQGGELADGSPVGQYEDMVVGVFVGFFWPVFFVLMREEGVFGKRRMMAVWAGVLINVLFGVVRLSA